MEFAVKVRHIAALSAISRAISSCPFSRGAGMTASRPFRGIETRKLAEPKVRKRSLQFGARLIDGKAEHSGEFVLNEWKRDEKGNLRCQEKNANPLKDEHTQL